MKKLCLTFVILIAGFSPLHAIVGNEGAFDRHRQKITSKSNSPSNLESTDFGETLAVGNQFYHNAKLVWLASGTATIDSKEGRINVALVLLSKDFQTKHAAEITAFQDQEAKEIAKKKEEEAKALAKQKEQEAKELAQKQDQEAGIHYLVFKVVQSVEGGVIAENRNWNGTTVNKDMSKKLLLKV